MQSCCCHVSGHVREKASAIVKKRIQGGDIKFGLGDNDLECVHCGELGSMMSFEFQKHLLDQRHYLAVRTEHPFEIYCNYCGDYQYDAEFDQGVGRKRMRTLTTSVPSIKAGSSSLSLFGPQGSTTSVASSSSGAGGGMLSHKQNHNNNNNSNSNTCNGGEVKRLEEMRNRPLPYTPPRGITNMGATCFMSSVLQVMLLSNEVRASLQQIAPFDEKGCIEVEQCRCRKRECELLEKKQQQQQQQEAALLAIANSANSGGAIKSEEQSPSPMMHQTHTQSQHSSGTAIDPMEDVAASPAATGGLVSGSQWLVSSNGNGGDSTPIRRVSSCDSLVFGSADRGSMQGLPASQQSGISSYHGEEEEEEPVTAGCIPCELRGLFVETLEGACAAAGDGSGDNTACVVGGGDAAIANITAAGGAVNSANMGGANGTAAASTTTAAAAVVSASSSAGDLASQATTAATASTAMSAAASPQAKGVVTTKKYRNKYPPLVPSKLLYAVWTFADHMAGYEQQDAHEFMIAFLDGIETHLKLYHSPPPPVRAAATTATTAANNNNKQKQKQQQALINHKVVTNIFSGVLSSEVQCASCGCISCTTEPFLDLSLSLDRDNMSSREQMQGTSLQTCMGDYTTPEALGTPIFCEKCKEHKQSVKKLSIKTPPQVLAVHLKRFDAVSQRKVHMRVNFPLEDFDISPYMQPISTDSSSSGKSGGGGGRNQQHQQVPVQQLYDLFGVVVHKGSLNSGHYISYVHGQQQGLRADQHSAGNNKIPSTQQQQSHQWLKCDDETITGVSMEEVRNVEGYILFYVRKQQQQYTGTDC